MIRQNKSGSPSTDQLIAREGLRWGNSPRFVSETEPVPSLPGYRLSWPRCFLVFLEHLHLRHTTFYQVFNYLCFM